MELENGQNYTRLLQTKGLFIFDSSGLDLNSGDKCLRLGKNYSSFKNEDFFLWSFFFHFARIPTPTNKSCLRHCTLSYCFTN